MPCSLNLQEGKKEDAGDAHEGDHTNARFQESGGGSNAIEDSRNIASIGSQEAGAANVNESGGGEDSRSIESIDSQEEEAGIVEDPILAMLHSVRRGLKRKTESKPEEYNNTLKEMKCIEDAINHHRS